MSSLPTTTVQGRPLTVPIKWQSIRAFVHLIQLLQVVIFDCARLVNIEEAESDFVFSIWFGKEVFKSSPIIKVDLPCIPSIRNLE
jgi:hypothetical protein